MKLWDRLTTCLMLLSAVCASSLLRATSSRRRVRTAAAAAENPLQLPPVHIRLSVSSPGISRVEADDAGWEETLAGGEEYAMEEQLPNQFEDVVDFIKVTISRIRRSSSLPTVSSSTSFSTASPPSKDNLSGRTRLRRERKKGVRQRRGRGGKGGVRGGGGSSRGLGCALKQMHLNVSDLGLGYRSGEEMIFRYCSGHCRKSETNYDKILNNLAHNRRFPPRDKPPPACCRPIAFDDDLSFLDDNLIYHTVRKHSARKCGCV